MTDQRVEGSTGFDDDDFVPPVPRRAANRIQTCPNCSKPIAKHGVMELLECADAADEKAEAERDWYMVQTRIAHEAKVKQALEARVADIDVIVNKEIPGYVLVRCQLDHDTWQSIKRVDDVKNFVAPNGVGRPVPVPQDEVDKFIPREEPKPKPNFEVFKERPARTLKSLVTPVPVVTAPPPPTAPTESPVEEIRDAWTSEVPFPTLADGEVDYEALVPFAAAMRTVLERERDEIIRRGGPIEKQNIELKERLAKMLDDLNRERRKSQVNAEARNMLQAQVDELVKTNRKLKNELKGRKETNHVHLNEISDILAVVDKTKGWTREMGGNGHWQIYKNGLWISDAAGSGGSTRVNQATRVKLRKAGLEV